MYDSGVIEAPCDGLVSGIEKNSAHLLAAEEEAVVAQPLDAGEGEFRLVLLSGSFEPICTGVADCQVSGIGEHLDGCPKACTHSSTDGGCQANQHFADCIKSCTHADNVNDCPATRHHYADCIKGCIHAKVGENDCPSQKHDANCTGSCQGCDEGTDCPAGEGYHEQDCIEACTRADNERDCTAKKHYSDCIHSCAHSKSENNPCTASKHAPDCFFAQVIYKAVVAKVDAVGDELVVLWDASGTQYDVVKTGNGWALASGQSINESLLISKNGPTLSNVGNYKKGDIIFYVVGYRLDQKVWEGVVPYRTAPRPTMPSFSFSFSVPSMGGYGSTSSQTQLYDLVGDVLMTVTPQDTMTLTVAVDESDISSVKTGMTAEITVTALPEQVFEGEITKVAKSGSGNGGSSKFTVEITLPREGEMLAGMSASAIISLYEKMDVLTLPAAALTEDGARTIVYTALDKKTGEPTSPVEVTTGLSDGETVEILSGLKSGETVYYAYYDTLEESDAVELDRMTVR